MSEITKSDQLPHMQAEEGRIYDARMLANIRGKAGLRILPDKERRCLKCEHAFLSQGGDRLCSNCQRTNSSQKWNTWGN